MTTRFCEASLNNPYNNGMSQHVPTTSADRQRNRIWLWLPAAALLLTLAAGAIWWWGRLPAPDNSSPSSSPQETRAPFLFRSMTGSSGINITYRNGQEADQYAILESIGGGIALLDYDGDGLLDVFITGGGYFTGPDKKEIKGHPCKLYRNLGGFRFQDVTDSVGLNHIDFYSHGAAVADYNCDGFPDLLVTGYGRLGLYRNDPVDPNDPSKGRKFTDVTDKAGLLMQPCWGTSAAWADLDGDGFPDLYVCQYVNWSWDNNPPCEGYSAEIPRDVCPPRQFDALPHLLFHNNGNGTFTKVALAAGLHGPRKEQDYAKLTWMSEESLGRLRGYDRDRDYGKGLGVVIVDVNGDRRPDIFVANDTTDKFLYINRSVRGQLRFENQALPCGVARDDQGVPNGSMGVDAGDYDGSGRPSLLVTNYQNEAHAIYRNLASGDRLLFEFNSLASGIASIGRKNVGFGASFIDIDNDGWEDVILVNGHVIRYPAGTGVRQRPILLHNEGRVSGKKDVRFTNVTDQGGTYFQIDHQARGLVVGDLDNDGRPDLIISHMNEPVAVLRNESNTGHHWFGVALADRKHRDMVGAKITLEVGNRTLTKFAKGGGSYLSSSDRRHLFGLGTAESVGRLTVTWPWGEPQTWDGLGVDRYWQLTAGEAQPEELYRR